MRRKANKSAIQSQSDSAPATNLFMKLGASCQFNHKFAEPRYSAYDRQTMVYCCRFFPFDTGPAVIRIHLANDGAV